MITAAPPLSQTKITHSAESVPHGSRIPKAGHSENSVFWRGKVLGYFDKMLSSGNYTPVQHLKHLEFFSEWVIPMLGPKPRSINGKYVPTFKSFMCDDHTPIELSLAWKSDSSKPIVRVGLEPLPTDEQANISQIVAYGLNVIDGLQQSFQVSVSEFADYFALDTSLFLGILKTIGFSNDQKDPTIVSNIFLGFDLLPCQVQLKAYCILSSSLDPIERIALIPKVVSAHATNTAASAISTYFNSKSMDWYSTYSPNLCIIGVDCTGTRDARIKIYVRYKVTDFDQIVDQFSLGGRIPVSPGCIGSLRDLWYRFVGNNCDPFLHPSDTSGVVFYYEFNTSKFLPSVKVNIPVRLMAKNDQAITDTTAEWLRSHTHFSMYKDSFLTMMSDTWNDRELCRTIGTFTYVSLSSAPGPAGCHPTIYFNPSVFSLAPPKDKPLDALVSWRKPLSHILWEAGATSVELPNDCLAIAQTWFDAFSKQIIDPYSHFGEIFTPNGFWRDLVALSADIRTLHPRSAIEAFLKDRSPCMRPTNFEHLTTKGRTISNSMTVVQGTFGLQTCVGYCNGVFTLVPTVSGEWKALTVVIGLEWLHGSTSRYSDDIKLVPDLVQHEDSPGIPPQNPRVVVIGGGQAGLSVAARLENIGVQTLVIERRERVGDSWRGRYESLYLNTPSTFSHLPFIPFPPEWPMFPGSDIVADHLEAYPRVLGLHVLTSTVVVGTRYDDDSCTWTLLIRRGNGNVFTVHTQHLVLANGVDTLAGSGPKVPDIPNASQFRGKTMHSTEFINGKPWSGKKAIVIGAGCSGHDIAQDLHHQGASVTIVQRSSISVVSREMLLALFPDLYTGDNPPPTAVADRLFLSFPLPITRSLQHELMKTKASIDADLLLKLGQKGFLLPDEEDNFFERLMIRREGYYVDQGCSSLIVKNEINIKAGIPITAYTPTGLLFADGTEVYADLVVYATGFEQESLIDAASRLLNYSLTGKVRPLGGWDAEHEIAGLWRPTGHRGLWFAGGDFFACRFYSRLLAMQIKAEDEGRFEATRRL